MRLNLMEHQEELAAHREILQKGVKDQLEDFAILVEAQDVPGVFDVYTPLKSGGYVAVSVDGFVVKFDEIIGEEQC